MSNTNVITHRLGGWSLDPDQCGAKSNAFERLLDLAIPVITNYRSDLYHDAIWLDRHIETAKDPLSNELIAPEDLVFYFVVRDYGTHIVQTDSWLAAITDSWRDSNVYTIAIVCDDGNWLMLVSQKED